MTQGTTMSLTDEMIEAGAKQIVMVGDDWAQLRSTWDDMPDYARDHYRDQARACYAAMHSASPTGSDVERVADAIANADLDGPDPEEYWSHLARAALQAMGTDEGLECECAEMLLRNYGHHPECAAGSNHQGNARA